MSGPITVVTSGSNIQNPTLQQTILNSTQPFTKLDTQNVVSFQTISVLFDHEPTQPPVSSPYYSITEIYQFSHGYNYIPSLWLMWQNQSPAFPGTPASGASATTFYPFGDDGAGSYALSSINNSESIDNNSNLLALVVYNNSGAIADSTGAILYATVDTTNVYINIMKYTYETYSGSIVPLYLAGTTLNLRCYIFTEPANNSTY